MFRLKKIISSNAVEKSLNAEIRKSERYRALILIGLLTIEAVFLLIIYAFYRDEYIRMFNTHLAIYAIFIFTGIIIIYEFLVHYILEKKRTLFNNYNLFGYFNSLSEISLLSLLLVYIIESSEQAIILQAPATLTYFIFIALSTFRLDFKLSVFTGVSAAAEFIMLSVYYSTCSDMFFVNISQVNLTGMQYLGQGLMMIITGIAAGFVADQIKTKIVNAWKNLKEKKEIIDLFGQQISPQIVQNILEKPNEFAGTRKQVCIMFLDIRQFTPFVEKHQPEEVVAYLNYLFGFMIDIVQSHNGVINQFLGDGFMATFGAPVDIGNSSQHAAETAREIIDRINIDNQKKIIPYTKIGIGLHFDEAITGNIGSAVRKQYSITGKVVIMASRIEQLNKTYDSCLLISAEVFNQLSEDIQSEFNYLDEVLVKGSKKPVNIYKYKTNCPKPNIK